MALNQVLVAQFDFVHVHVHADLVDPVPDQNKLGSSQTPQTQGSGAAMVPP